MVSPIAEYMYVSYIYPVFKIKKQKCIPDYYLLKTLKNEEYKTIINDYCLGGARADLKIDWLSRIKIIPPSQAELEKYQKLSDTLGEAYQQYLRIYNEIMR